VVIQGTAIITTSVPYYAINAPSSVTFDGSQSVGLSGAAIKMYTWSLDGAVVLSGAAAAQYKTTFWTTGSRSLRLKVTDSAGHFFTKTLPINIGPAPIAQTLDRATIATAVSVPSNSLVTDYSWDFGDGSTAAHGSMLTSLSYQYSQGAQENYKITLTETTSHGEQIISTTAANFESIGTDVAAGPLPDSEYWNASGSPYRIHGVVGIPAGTRLTIEPGAVVQFDSQSSVLVSGELQSNGQFSGKRLVTLTSINDQTPLDPLGVDTSTNSDWAGLNIQNGGTANTAAMVIRHASTGIQGYVSTVTGAIFDRDHDSLGPGVTRQPFVIANNTFLNCDNDFFTGNDGANPPVLTGNTFTGTGFYIYNFGGADCTVANNLFDGGAHAYFIGIFGQLQFSGNRGADGASIVMSNATLTKNNTWQLQNNLPYQVRPTPLNPRDISPLYIAAGATLTLAKGMVIQLSEAGIQVSGVLRSASRTPGSVILTSTTDDSPFGGDDTTTDYAWSGLFYLGVKSADLSGITIRHAYVGLSGYLATISNGTFDRNIFAIACLPMGPVACTISGNTFSGPYNSFYYGMSGTINVVGNTFITTHLNLNSYVPGSSNSQVDATITNNSFSKGAYADFYGRFGLLRLSGNKGSDGACIQLLDTELTKDNTWTMQNNMPYTVPIIEYSSYFGLTIDQGATLTLSPGMVIQLSHSQITVRGGIATPGGNVTLTSMLDQSPYGKPDKAGRSDWAGVYAGYGTANLTGCSIRHASVGLTVGAANLQLCRFTANTAGIVSRTGGGTYRYCAFSGNSLAIGNDGTTKVDAQKCWWGDPSGPHNTTSNPNGHGDEVSDNVLFGSYLHSAPAPVPSISSIYWSSTPISGGKTLIILGTGFVPSSIAQWNQQPISTKYVSPTKLTATVPTALLVSTSFVRVVSPSPGGGFSNAVPSPQ